jgi:hypothetical protein
MKQQIEDSINQLYNRIMLKSGFMHKDYIKHEIKRMCKNIQFYERSLTILKLKGEIFSPNILDMVNKIKEFTCN